METLTLTQEQLNALVQEQVAKAMASMPKKGLGLGPKAGTIIKPNDKGGLFIMDTRAKAYSEGKGKEYVTNINIHKHQLSLIQLICSDKKLRDSIVESMKEAKEVRY